MKRRAWKLNLAKATHDGRGDYRSQKSLLRDVLTEEHGISRTGRQWKRLKRRLRADEKGARS